VDRSPRGAGCCSDRRPGIRRPDGRGCCRFPAPAIDFRRRKVRSASTKKRAGFAFLAITLIFAFFALPQGASAGHWWMPAPSVWEVESRIKALKNVFRFQSPALSPVSIPFLSILAVRLEASSLQRSGARSEQGRSLRQAVGEAVLVVIPGRDGDQSLTHHTGERKVDDR
jgi:hypothetical protein